MSLASEHDGVAQVRGFNRFFTKIIGALDEGLLDSPYTLTEVRVLFELRHRQPVSAAQLCESLNVDAGYLSRIVSRFVDQGLVSRAPDAADARRRLLGLTTMGRTVFDTLDAESTAHVQRLLSGLGPGEREDLVEATSTIRRLLGDPAVGAAVSLRSPRPGDFGWVISRNGALYAAEHGWNAEYEALVAGVVADFASSHDPSCEAAWIAEVDGCRVGAIFCVRVDAETAKLRVLFVEPSTRGRGVGAALVDECVRFARQAGYRRMKLWTVSMLKPAGRMYRRAGFSVDSQEAVHMFGHELTAQEWSRQL